MFVFGILAFAAVILSVIIIAIGRLSCFIYDDVDYAPIPSNAHPDQYEDEDEDEDEDDDDEDTTFILADIVSNQSMERFDYFTSIKRWVKHGNVDSDISILVGSMIALSASIWGVVWRMFDRHHHYKTSVYFTTMSLLVWLYITGLSLVNMRYSKLSTSIPRMHQMVLIIVAYVCNVADFIVIYKYEILEFQLPESRSVLIFIFGATITFIGLLMTRGPVEVTSSGRLMSLEISASLYEWMSFSWISPLMTKGAKRTLGSSDLWELPYDDQAVAIIKKYNKCRANRPFSPMLLFMACKNEIIKQQLYGALWSISLFAVPAFFYFLLDDFNVKSGADSYAWFYLFGMFASMIISSVFYQLGNMEGYHSMLQFKAIISNEIFKMCLKRRLPCTKVNSTSSMNNGAKSSEWDSGAVANLLNADIATLEEAITRLHLYSGSILQIIIAFPLLWYIVGPASVFGLVALILCILIQGIRSLQSVGSIHERRIASEKRLSIITEALHSIRIVKLFAWEPQVYARTDEARELELVKIWETFVGFAFFLGNTSITPVIVTVATLAAYTVIYKNTLTATVAFTAIALFESLRVALQQMPSSIFYYANCISVFKRVNSFLSQPIIDITASTASTPVDDTHERIGIVDGTFAWSLPMQGHTLSTCSDKSDTSVFVLNELNVNFMIGELNIIAGPTGCGKSSLLMALLGEMPRVHGKVFLPTNVRHASSLGIVCSNIGYVAQQAWLQNTTIRDNILFGQTYDEQRYRQVLHACALERDLEILDAGDYTIVGEKGIMLSGGQKQRLALARAVYGPYQYLLLDDCLSSVDTHTARHIIEHCLSGPLMQGRTCILVTHHIELCASIAKFAVLMNAGQIVATGAPLVALASLLSTSDSDSDVTNMTDSSDVLVKHPKRKGSAHRVQAILSNSSFDVRANCVSVEQEVYASGEIPGRVYKTYIGAAGYHFWIISIGAYLFLQLLIICQAYWLVIWTQNASLETNGYYIRGYLWYTLTQIRAGRVLFKEMLHRVLYASIRFLDKTPIGRLINRFSKDISDVDSTIIFALQHTTSFASRMVFQLLIVCFALPWFITVSVIIFYVYYLLVRYYLKTSRNLKRLEAVNKSPLLSLCTDILNGAATVRAFGMQEWFTAQNIRRIDTMQRPFYLQGGADQWIICRIQVISSIFTLIAAGCFIWNRDKIGAGVAGFALSYALGFLTSAANVIQQYTRIDIAMSSVERIDEYLWLEQEPAAIIDEHRPPPNLDQVNALALSVEQASDTGGAGKSTMSLAFFRFVEAFAGRILIDDIDIATIGLRDLRSRLTIIPQDPVLFSGTIRSNLDPFSMHDDAELWNALRRAHLIDADVHAEKPAGLEHLDAPVTENGSNFSHGQRQLLSMARALLRNSRVIIMDEATASIDLDTDAKIQDMIRQEFDNSTLLCVAHRLRTIIDYDRVMVLDTGRLVEFDKPSVLIKQPDSLFRNLCERSGELELLLAMSQNNSSIFMS
ncbi:hypothetical protein BDF22DRAFT_777181 [Syncephalis plumigaleata]|nr:hypothetical protein BDF22DRAFT_777181 [Syncephalis plumigaleata]